MKETQGKGIRALQTSAGAQLWWHSDSGRVTAAVGAGQAVQQPQHHTGGSHQAPHWHHQKLSVSLVGLAHTHGPITTGTPTCFPQEQLSPLRWHWEGEEGSVLAEIPKKEPSALEEQHLLQAVSASSEGPGAERG